MPTAINTVAGSQLIKRANGTIALMTPDALIIYEGKPSLEAIVEALDGEDALIVAAIQEWLFRVVGIGDSRFHSLPINCVMTAPKKVPSGIGPGRL